MGKNPKEGGSPNISISIKPYKLHLAVSKDLEKFAKVWNKPAERLFSHFMSVLELIYIRKKSDKEFMELLEKCHKDIEMNEIEDVKSAF